MSGSGLASDARNGETTRAALAQLDRGRNDGRGQVGAYEGEEGRPRPATGDEDAPFVKMPPFTEEPVLWTPGLQLSTSVYVQTSAVDVAMYRLLQILFELSWTGAGASPDTSQLSIIPEHLARSTFSPPEAWYPTAVVDPSVSYITPTGFGDGFGSRTFAPAELRTRAFTSTTARIQRFCLQFDVTNAKAFRLNLAELVSQQVTSKVALAYQRSN